LANTIEPDGYLSSGHVSFFSEKQKLNASKGRLAIKEQVQQHMTFQAGD